MSAGAPITNPGAAAVAAAPPGNVAPGRHKSVVGRRRRQEQRFGWLLITPAILGIAIFTAFPILASFLLSFFSYNVISSPHWVGLQNYSTLIHDSEVRKAFLVTVIMGLGIVILQTGLGLLLAVAVQRRMKRWRALYRAAFFVPMLVSAAAISIAMSYIFDDQFGVLNYYLHQIGLPQVAWLGSTAGSIMTIILVAVWQQLGFTFIVFSAALGGVPREMLEAASVDGASAWRRFRSITLPMISPSVLFVSTVGLINALQLFDQPYIITKGGPGTATQSVVLTIYQDGFQDLRFGYASTISVLLFVVVLIATFLQFRLSRRYVFYS